MKLAPLLLLATLLPACSGPSRQTPLPTPPAVTPLAEAEPAPAPNSAAIVAASNLPALLPAPLAGDAMGVTIHRLANGMTVYISTDREQPRISARIAVRAGSRNDPAESTGLAHYLEHMLFKGTGKLATLDIDKERPHLDRIAELYRELRATSAADARARILAELDAATQRSAAFAVPNEFVQLYASLGVTGVNAFTSNDQTVYIATVPSNRFAAWARVEAERFIDPQFRLFFTEIETVYEEKNRAMDNPGRRVSEALVRALFPLHPYGTQPTLGHAEHLKNPAYGDMVAYFERWYVANNMAILLAGDIDAATALPILEAAFADLAPAPLPAPRAAPLPALSGRTLHELEAEGENSVRLAWHTVAENHTDQVALEVMDRLVDNAESGLLNIDLVLSQKLPRAGSWVSHYNEAGYFAIYGVAKSGQSLTEVEALLLGVIARLKAGDFSQADIDAIVINSEISDKRALESTGARVARMSAAFIARTPWPMTVSRLDRLARVTREQVIAVANKYLSDNFTVVRRKQGNYEPPRIDKPDNTKVDIAADRESAFARAVRAMPSAELTPEWVSEGTHYQRSKIAAGDLLVVANPRNDLFSLRYRFDIGSRRSRLLCHALTLLTRAGAGELSAAELKKKLYAMGTKISTNCGRDRTSIWVSGLDRNLEASVAMVDAWLRKPAFDARAVADLATNTISQRRDRMAEASFVGGALTNYARWGKSSSYLLTPSNKALRRARPKTLRRLLTTLLDQEHVTVYFGPRPAAEVAALVALGKKHRRLAPRPAARYRKSNAITIYFADKKTSQAKISVAFPHAPMTNPDRAISKLYGEYLGGGMGALIFQHIRESRSLAYSSWGGHTVGTRPDDDAVLYAGLGTQNDKAIAAIRALLDLLADPPIEASRLTTAKAAIDRRYRAARVEARRVAGWVLHWQETGEHSDPRPQRWQAINQLTADDLAAFAAGAAAGPTIITIVGDRDRIDMRELAKIGKIEIKTIAELVAY